MHDPLAVESGSGRASLESKTRALWIDCATAIRILSEGQNADGMDCQSLPVAVLKATDGGPEMPSWLTEVVQTTYARNDGKACVPAGFASDVSIDASRTHPIVLSGVLIQGMVQNA